MLTQDEVHDLMAYLRAIRSSASGGYPAAQEFLKVMNDATVEQAITPGITDGGGISREEFVARLEKAFDEVL